MEDILPLVLLGDSATGKSALFLRFHCDKFDDRIDATINPDFYSK